MRIRFFLLLSFIFSMGIFDIAASGASEIPFSEEGERVYKEWLLIHDDLFVSYTMIPDDIIPILKESLSKEGNTPDSTDMENNDVNEYIEQALDILSNLQNKSDVLSEEWEKNFFNAQINFDKWSLTTYMGQDIKSAYIYFENAFGLASRLEVCSNSEVSRLIGDLYSAKIRYSGSGGMTWGMRSAKMYSKAIDIDKSNGAALLGYGIGLYFTPPIGGGSKTKALAYLDKANSSSTDLNTEMMSRIWKAYISFKMGNVIEANDIIDQVIADYPKQVLAYELKRFFNDLIPDPFLG